MILRGRLAKGGRGEWLQKRLPGGWKNRSEAISGRCKPFEGCWRWTEAVGDHHVTPKLVVGLPLPNSKQKPGQDRRDRGHMLRAAFTVTSASC